MRQEISVSPAWYLRGIVRALAVSLGLHLSASAALLVYVPRQPPQDRQAPVVMVVLERVGPAVKPAPQAQAIPVVEPVPQPVTEPAPTPILKSLPVSAPAPVPTPVRKSIRKAIRRVMPRVSAQPIRHPRPPPLPSAAPPAAQVASAPASATKALRGAPARQTIEATYIPPDASAAYLNNPRPAYPRAARRAGMEGRCLLEVAVDASGAVRSVRILRGSGHALLDRAAMAAVEHWRFLPARRSGRAVAALVEVPIRFHLTQGGG